MLTPLSWRAIALAALAAIPWLNPFAAGPSPAVQPWLVSAACVLAMWLLAAAGGTATRPRVVWPCLALVSWAALSHLAVRPEIVFLAAGLAVVAISAGLAGTSAAPQALQSGFLLAAAVSATFGLLQYFGAASDSAGWLSAADPGTAFANLRQPNQYATLCWMGVALVLWGTLRLPWAASVALVVLLAAGGAASASRTGMLEGGVLLALAILWRGPERRQRLILCGLAVLVYGAASWSLPVLLEASTGVSPERMLWARMAEDAGCARRLVLWSNVLHLIAQKPLTGWGWGELDYAHFMTLYGGNARFCEILDNAHNLPLHLAVELGIPAALLACGGAFVWAWRRRPWADTDPLRQLAWALLALIALHSLLEYPLWYGPFQIAFGASLGWLLGGRSEQPAAPARWLRVAPAALLLAAVVYAAWDYTRVTQIYLPPEERRAAWREQTLDHARASWLFSGQARFADLTLASPTRANARWMYALAHEVLHYSPEPAVVRRLVESATLLGREDEAVLHLARFRAAYPKDYEAWRRANRSPLAP